MLTFDGFLACLVQIMCEVPERTGGGSWYCMRAPTLMPHATGPLSVPSHHMLTSQLWKEPKQESAVTYVCVCLCVLVFNVSVFRTSLY